MENIQAKLIRNSPRGLFLTTQQNPTSCIASGLGEYSIKNGAKQPGPGSENIQSQTEPSKEGEEKERRRRRRRRRKTWTGPHDHVLPCTIPWNHTCELGTPRDG
jgi:hypothetical protein